MGDWLTMDLSDDSSEEDEGWFRPNTVKAFNSCFDRTIFDISDDDVIIDVEDECPEDTVGWLDDVNEEIGFNEMMTDWSSIDDEIDLTLTSEDSEISRSSNTFDPTSNENQDELSELSIDNENMSDEDASNDSFQLSQENYEWDSTSSLDGAEETSHNARRDNFSLRIVEANGMEDLGLMGDSHDRGAANHECPICLKPLDSQEVGNPCNCRHYFCINCILEWVRRNNTCPVDRKTIYKIAVRCKMGSPVKKVVYVIPHTVSAEV